MRNRWCENTNLSYIANYYIKQVITVESGIEKQIFSLNKDFIEMKMQYAMDDKNFSKENHCRIRYRLENEMVCVP